MSRELLNCRDEIKTFNSHPLMFFAGDRKLPGRKWEMD
jgi:hypothetical protein